MASQNQRDMQDLLRLLTTGRNKVTMLQAMQRIKSLQAASIPPSIAAISITSLADLSAALAGDEKAAKSLIAACKTASKKRSLDDSASSGTTPPAKRAKSFFELPAAPSAENLEASLALPQPSTDEERIEKTRIYTNRAPLVLAFAVQLLKFTMPEQPLSSRLSLAQAVCSANSRSKAVSLGIEKKDEGEDWGTGQPKVRVLNREIAVLKRGGYEWEGPKQESTDTEETIKQEEGSVAGGVSIQDTEWTVSSSVTSKSSTFVARSLPVTSSHHARSAIQSLLSEHTELREASHNITAFRISTPSGNIIEECDDDGESGGGRHILQVLKSSNAINVVIVLTRWYGGVFLGPDRWRIMSEVSRDALSQRLRVKGVVGAEALWGLNLGVIKDGSGPVTGSGMPIHQPEGARNYIMKAFASPPEEDDQDEKAEKGKGKKKTARDMGREKEENLGLLLGALDLLFASWVGHMSREELDRKAWAWYVQVRPDVESGVAGWGGKGEVKLGTLLALRRKPVD